MEKYTKISERLRRELENIREDEQDITLAQLLTVKSHISGLENWLDVAECEEATEKNLLVLARNMKNMDMSEFDDDILRVANAILKHDKVTDEILNELATNINFLRLQELDWTRAGDKTLVTLAKRINSFYMEYLYKKYIRFVEEICEHKNATSDVWKVFEGSEVEVFKEIAIKCMK